MAMAYARGERDAAQASTVMKMQMDCGADISWFSQYPHEKSIILPPYSALEVIGADIDGAVLVV